MVQGKHYLEMPIGRPADLAEGRQLGQLRNIQALRGVAVVLVVLVHLAAIEKKYAGSVVLLPGMLDFGMFGVDIFFVISGFIMATVTTGKFRNPGEALRFIYHRAARIYPTYWVYSILVLAVYLLQPAWVNSSQGSRVDILASFLLLPSNTLPLVMVGWTLIHEMYFYGVFFLLMLGVAERSLLFALVFWGIGIALANLAFEITSPVMKVVSHPLTVEFIGGCLLAIVCRGRGGDSIRLAAGIRWPVCNRLNLFLSRFSGRHGANRFVWLETGTNARHSRVGRCLLFY